MTTIYFDPAKNDKIWRDAIYAGNIIILSPTPEMLELIKHSRTMIETAYAPVDPQRAHEDLAVEQCVEMLSRLKPCFIHNPRTNELIARVLRVFGCSRKNVPGRAAFALRFSKQLPYYGDRLRPPSSSRYLVFGTDVSVKLVGSDIRVCF